jgi:hypothetical protein
MDDKIKKSVLRLPEDLHTRVKAAVAVRHTTLQQAIQDALAVWLSEPSETIRPKLSSTESPDPRRCHADLTAVITTGPPDAVQAATAVLSALRKYSEAVPHGHIDHLAVAQEKLAEAERIAKKLGIDTEQIEKHGEGARPGEKGLRERRKRPA